MRIHKLVFAFLVFVFFVSSCSNDKQSKETSVLDENLSKLTEDEVKVLVRMRNPKNRVSVEEAVKQTDWVIDFMNVGESSVSRKISSISALTSDNAEFIKALKSKGIEVPDTLIYVVNFADSLGFAIISADTRIDDPLIGFSGSGFLKDSIDNPGMIIFLEHLEDYMQNSIIEAERQKDSLIGGIWEKLDVETGTKATSQPSISVSSPEATGIVYPLVHVEWDQVAPFNNSLKDKNCYGKGTANNGKVKVGCVAVAVAQIMSYWKYPAKIGKYSFDWAELNKYTGNRNPLSYRDMAQTHIDKADNSIKSQVANLMMLISNGVGMDYGCKESTANKFSGPSFLLANGFSLESNIYAVGTGAALIGYDPKKAIASIKREEPLIVRGCDKKTDYKLFGLIHIYTNYTGCHQWVIDGYIPRRTTVKIGNISTSYDSDYIHNNWGWGGIDNGYFESGIFNSNLTPINPVQKTKSYEEYNFRYEVLMTPYIRR
ncbi:MAG: C10 family peptidase [Fibromonadaceae bacterium]|nr:C10 family peptidase [Fibromonadaceae bacterium]